MSNLQVLEAGVEQLDSSERAQFRHGSSVLTLPIGIGSWSRMSRRVCWIGWPTKPWLIWLPVGAASGEASGASTVLVQLTKRATEWLTHQ